MVNSAIFETVLYPDFFIDACLRIADPGPQVGLLDVGTQ